MAQKVINTYYIANAKQESTNNYLEFTFGTKGELKQWLSKLTRSFASPTHIIVELNKVEVKWDDSTKYVSSTSTAITVEDL